MPYRMTSFEAGGIYHLYNRGANRSPIFLDRDNYLFFLRRVRKHLVAELLDVLAYCLMPNHYHLLVRLRRDGLTSAMHALATSYAKAFNKRHGRSGHVFEGPLQAIAVEDDGYLLHLSRYIHLNPSKAGLVARPEDWEFSSYPKYVGVRDGTLPRTDFVLAQIGSPSEYRRFIEEYAVAEGIIDHLLFDEG
jgi:putative transposase